jgi:hypothetical protein
VMAACGWCHSVVVWVEGRVWTFGFGYYGQLGHNDEQHRLVPKLLAAELFDEQDRDGGRRGLAHHDRGSERSAVGVGHGILRPAGPGRHQRQADADAGGAEEVFVGSKVRTIACGNNHTLAMTEAGKLWAWGRGARARTTGPQRRATEAGADARVDPQHFAHAPISAVAAGFYHSAAVTAGDALYTWGKGEAEYTGPCQQARADPGAAAAPGRGACGAVTQACLDPGSRRKRENVQLGCALARSWTERRAVRSERDLLRDKIREVGRGLSLADTQTGR